jgi:hypothetical protein
MSAGAYTLSRYIATYDIANIHPIRVQPETIAASIGGTSNAPPAGAANTPISARVSGSKRTLGLVARRVRLRAPLASPPAGYLAGGTTTIPALNETFYAAAVKGASVSYLGSTFTVVGRSPESVN